jgi:hypothetical protein
MKCLGLFPEKSPCESRCPAAAIPLLIHTYVNAVAPQVYASEHENLRKDRFDHRLGHFGELLVSLSLLPERRLK